MAYWEKVNSISDLKSLSVSELESYAAEVREHIIDTVQKNGGHLASNLGSVELTLALHYVFDMPKDKIVWDVGHQSYTHKIVTGRRDDFDTIRKEDGISGFPKPSENECDSFISGHSSTSLSAALGLARARDLTGDDYNVIGVIGDGAMTGGMAYEAINDIGESREKLIIILNDNKMSISPNVGAFSTYLARLRLSKPYAKFKLNLKRGVEALPFFGDKLVDIFEHTRDNLKSIILSDKLFENFGIKYYGPFDGHNIGNMIELLRQIKSEKRPVLVHLITNKGNGYEIAESDSEKFHGVNPSEEQKSFSFSADCGNILCSLAEKDERIVAVTAAMKCGTGLDKFFDTYPSRSFDVAIAEQHAVTMAAGMAKGGLKPYFAVYSSFLQRGIDQIIHDVCIDNLPVTFLIDRAGAVGADGVTHQGVFDLSYLNMIPNISIFAPKDGKELEEILKFSLTFDAPLAIRYPKSYSKRFETHEPISLGKWEILHKSDNKKYIIATGNRMLDLAMSIPDVNVVNAKWIKPLDTEFLKSICNDGTILLTLEDNVLQGGFGQSVLAFVSSLKRDIAVKTLGYKKFVEDMSVSAAMKNAGLSVENIKKILNP